MEKRHLAQLRRQFGERLDEESVFVLHIPDDFPYMEPELVDLLEDSVSEHLLPNK